jgi:hypothetical protein
LNWLKKFSVVVRISVPEIFQMSIDENDIKEGEPVNV